MESKGRGGVSSEAGRSHHSHAHVPTWDDIKGQAQKSRPVYKFAEWMSNSKNVRRKIAMATIEEKTAAVLNMRRIRKSVQKVRAERRLHCISASIGQKAMPQVLQINGFPTSDRQLWLQEAYRFGRSRFGCSANHFEAQRTRMALATSQAKAQRIDGRSTPALSPFSVVSGRARLKPGTSAGSDNAPP